MEEQKKEQRKTIKMELEVTVTPEDIDDIVCTALESGIGYWACLDNSTEEFENAPEEETVSETTSRLLKEGKTITLIDEEEDEKHELTLEKLLAGIKLYLEDKQRPYNILADDLNSTGYSKGTYELDCYMIDADVADMIVQYAVFGEVVFA